MNGRSKNQFLRIDKIHRSSRKLRDIESYNHRRCLGAAIMHGNRNLTVIHHPLIPGVKVFALLSTLESAAWGILISVLPIAMYRVFADAKLISEIYFYVGVLSLAVALTVPMLNHWIPLRLSCCRHWPPASHLLEVLIRQWQGNPQASILQ